MPKDNCNAPPTELWVSPDLALLSTTHYPQDTYTLWGSADEMRTYWRLTAAVYAWIVRKMRAARSAAESGKLSAADWEWVQARFAAVKAAADANPEVARRLGTEQVQTALAHGGDLPRQREAEHDRRMAAFLCGCQDAPQHGLGWIVQAADGNLHLVGA